jgi:hypothetical protein
VVLNDLRDSALAYISTGQGDSRLGWFEWSAPQDASPTDINALAMANPNLGRRIDPEALLAKAERAVRKGGEALAGFKTEYMCISVRMLNPAIDPTAWSDCANEYASLDDVRDHVLVCVDVAPDSEHVTLCAAAPLPDGRIGVEVVAAWSTTDAARFELRPLLERVKPRAVAWFPSGPAAVLAPLLRPQVRNGQTRGPWDSIELKGLAVTEACQGLADLVLARKIVHPDNPLLNHHIGTAEKYNQGDGWRFVRRGAGHVDAAYAAAGAVHAVQTVPKRVKAQVW